LKIDSYLNTEALDEGGDSYYSKNRNQKGNVNITSNRPVSGESYWVSIEILK